MCEDLQVTDPSDGGIAIYPPGASFGPRRLKDFEFVWMIEGDATYVCDEIVTPAPQGSVVLCRRGVRDAFQWDSRRKTRHGFFHFKVSTVPQAWPAMEQWPLVWHPVEGDILRPLFRHVLTWLGRGNAMQQRLTVAQMLTAFVSGQVAAADVPADALPEPVERALSYIHHALERRPDGAIRLSDLAETALVTSEHLCRLFKQATGHTPVETVRLARLDAAAVLITRSNYAVKQVAAMYGFSSPFHFSRRFHEAFGMSPREMRQRVRSGAIPALPLLLRQSRRAIRA
jgi:AraC family transcriptional regulator